MAISPYQSLIPTRTIRESFQMVTDSTRQRERPLSQVALEQASNFVADQVVPVLFQSVKLAQSIFHKPNSQTHSDGIRAFLPSLTPESAPPEKRFPLWMFEGVNVRGIRDYDKHFFEDDLLEKLGLALHPKDTILWKMIDQLPQGAVMADWGGGAGIFGYEVKVRRPDLKIYVNDLYPPKDILKKSELKKPTIRDLRRSATFLTGDALTTRLPEKRRANLIVSASLSPYVPDPLGLLAHLYNQLRPGGILLTSLTTEIYDAKREDKSVRSVIVEVLDELRRIGLPLETASRNKTFVMQRLDERELKLHANRVANHYEVVQVGSRGIGRYVTFYQSSGFHRWFQLAKSVA